MTAFIHKRSMCNWAGKFKFIPLLVVVLLHPVNILAADEEPFHFGTTQWNDFSNEVETQIDKDYRNGVSYIISGSIALVGGILGAGGTSDGAEKAIYTVFQSIGVASIGYGFYTWQIGGEERSVYRTLQSTKFTSEYKTHFLKAYNIQRREREQRDRFIRAITHGMIAALNLYNASQQKEESTRNALNFIGGVNLLAAASFTIDF